MSATHTAVGVIGAGLMGSRHALNIANAVPSAALAGVTDVDTARAEALAAGVSGAQVFPSAEALIADPGVDAVIIASPDDTHVGLTLECLRQEKPVLCEKPLAWSSSEAQAVLDEEIKLGRRLVQVGFMRHYDPAHAALKKALDSGAIGSPAAFKGWHRNVAPAAQNTGEGVIFNSAIHDLESCRWLMGQEVEEAFVRGRNSGAESGDGEIEMVFMQLVLGGGGLAAIECNVHARYGYEVGVEVIGQTGSVSTQPPDAAILRSGGARSHSIGQDFADRFNEAYVIEVQEWVRSLEEGGPTGPASWDGFASLVAAEACVRALRSGQPEKAETPPRPAFYS